MRKTISENELHSILTEHQMWLDSGKKRGIPADLANVDLAQTMLIRTDLREANLSGANFVEADLSEANLTGANLSKVDLSRSYLFKTNLSHANLQQANLTGAKLAWTKLNFTNLKDADLRESMLTRVRFDRRSIFERHSISLRLRPPKKWYDLGLSEIDSRVLMSFFKFIPCIVEDLKMESHYISKLLIFLVAGVGFEPTTFGL